MHGIATLRFWGMLGSDDGTRLERMYAEWPAENAIDLAFAAADEMMRTVVPKWTSVALERPLQDRRILVTGSESHIGAIEAQLAHVGAQVDTLATIEIDTMRVQLPGNADWLVLTSKHAVPAIDWTTVTMPVAAVGEGTADAIREAGVEPTLVANGPGAGQLADELKQTGIAGKRVVCVLSDIARQELTDQLAAAGAELIVLTGYRNTPVTHMPDELRADIAAGRMEAVTFASPSSVAAFVEVIGIDLPALSGAAMLAIGPTTADAMRQHGLPVHAMAGESTVAGLIATLARYFGGDHLQE